jgi:rhodanese-related sulfurtransferase
MGGNRSYQGAIGTSVVRVFEAVAGITGLSLKQARAAGIEADSVVVHKEHHTSYYPGAQMVSVTLIFDKKTGTILGGQTAGYKGADKRLDVIAMATASKMTIHDLADVDFAYSPPIGTANDAMNMAAYTAENKLSGFSPSVTVAEIDSFVEGKQVTFIDVRDYFTFEKSHLQGATHMPLELIQAQMHTLPRDKYILVYDETGKKGHQVLRMLVNAGFKQVINISGGYISLQRHATSIGFRNIQVESLPVRLKTLKEEEMEEKETEVKPTVKNNTPILVDVRTPAEFKSGAVDGAINIPLDEIKRRYKEFGEDVSREITVYCASGARSAYAQNVLKELGYTNVTNGGGISAMIANQKAKANGNSREGLLVVDVRTPREFQGGAYPGAVNIPLDELPKHVNELGSLSREIIVYCASGARSSYAQQFLSQQGFKNVKNGGGIMQMMMKAQKN